MRRVASDLKESYSSKIPSPSKVEVIDFVPVSKAASMLHRLTQIERELDLGRRNLVSSDENDIYSSLAYSVNEIATAHRNVLEHLERTILHNEFDFPEEKQETQQFIKLLRNDEEIINVMRQQALTEEKQSSNQRNEIIAPLLSVLDRATGALEHLKLLEVNQSRSHASSVSSLSSQSSHAANSKEAITRRVHHFPFERVHDRTINFANIRDSNDSMSDERYMDDAKTSQRSEISESLDNDEKEYDSEVQSQHTNQSYPETRSQAKGERSASMTSAQKNSSYNKPIFNSNTPFVLNSDSDSDF